MKILVDDGLQLGMGTGIGNYARYLTESLAVLPDTTAEREDFRAKGSRRRARLAYLAYLASPRYRAKLRSFDVVHYANYAMPRRVPRGVITAVTVHDLTAFLHPDTLSRGYAAYNRFMIRRAAKRADIIFTVSEAVREEFLTRFPRAASKTSAVYPGHYDRITDAPVAKEYESSTLTGLKKRKFFLFIGTIEKRKNLGILIEAYQKLRATLPEAAEYALVLAGRDGFGAEVYHEMAKNAPVTGDIRFTGYVSTADCTKLYHEAAAFIFPSIYEGFGSPQTECMACRLPLLLSDIPTNREVSGEYGRYFPPQDAAALATLMAAILRGEWDAAEAEEAAAKRLALFRREDAAAKTLAIYQSRKDAPRSGRHSERRKT